MNELKIIFDQENNEITFSTNIGEGLIDTHFILSELSDEDFYNLVLSKAQLIFKYYKQRILDEQD